MACYKNIGALGLVIGQFSCIALLALTAPVFSSVVWILSIQVLGVAWGLYSIFEMRSGNLTASPLPRKDSSLVTSGPYRYVRHPMYTGLIMIFLPAVAENLTPTRLVVLTLFLLIISFKIKLEEELLGARYPDYSDYKRKTKNLFPYLF
jgi:protein-S-isoprenylcysteine O-methyltransferase Ste14